jgi:hypothetical protein
LELVVACDDVNEIDVFGNDNLLVGVSIDDIFVLVSIVCFVYLLELINNLLDIFNLSLLIIMN